MSSKLLLLLSGLVFLLGGFIYILTLSPALSFIDSGELATCCATLGIAHPSGYPLYVLLGRIFSLFPFGKPIYLLNLMSAFWISLTNLCFFLSLFILSGIFFPKEYAAKLKVMSAVLVTALFSFSPILWSQAVINEVYSLNIFLCSLIILIALYWYKRNSSLNNPETFNPCLIYLLAYLLGLGSGNHLLSLFIFPALFFLLITSGYKGAYSLKSLILIAGFFILGISIYLYLPIRSSLDPALNWGNPSSWLNLKNHLTAKMYQSRMFSETQTEFWNNLRYFGSTFLKQFPVWAFPIMLLGFLRAIKQNLRIDLFFFLIIFFNLLWSLNYGIKDIDPYFLQTILVSGFFLFSGLLFFFQLLEKLLSFLKSSSRLKIVLNYSIVSVLIIFFLLRFPGEFKSQNRSKNYIPYDFTSNILRSAHKDALILTEVWDYYSPWLYLRFVENKRPDLLMVSTDLLEWSWFQDHLQKYYPRLYGNSSPEIEAYNQFALKIEKGQKVNSLDASVALSRMIDSFILKNIGSLPVYITFLDAYKGYSGLPVVTEGLLMRFREERKFYPYDFPRFALRGISNPQMPKTDKELVCIAHYAVAHYNRALYLEFFNYDQEAESYFKKAYYFKELLLKHKPSFKFIYF